MTKRLLRADAEIERLEAKGLSHAEAVARYIGDIKPKRASTNGEKGNDHNLIGIDFASMEPHLRDGYVVKGIAGRNALVSIIGPTSSAKTFLATDLAVHIAARKAWRGNAVRGGLAVYAALEGPVSAENRFVAIRLAGDFEPTIPLRLTPGPINLRAASDIDRLIRFVRKAEEFHAESCAAVFIDTLARAIAGGDENGSIDMGALVAGADAVRLATGATVFLVHHLGKDEGRGARGHSSFRAAIDTEIELSVKDNVRIATITKNRDGLIGYRIGFTLEPVELGRDDDGDPVTSCVVQPVDELPSVRKQPSGKNQTALLAALLEWQRGHDGQDIVPGTELHKLATAQGIGRKRLPEVLDGLRRYNWIVDCVGGIRLLPDWPESPKQSETAESVPVHTVAESENPLRRVSVGRPGSAKSSAKEPSPTALEQPEHRAADAKE